MRNSKICYNILIMAFIIAENDEQFSQLERGEPITHQQGTSAPLTGIGPIRVEAPDDDDEEDTPEPIECIITHVEEAVGDIGRVLTIERLH